MKTTLLLLVLASLSIKAQTTHDLNWQTGLGTNVDLTIEVGDIVRWSWTDNLSHTVTNKPGSSEIFDSGTISGNGLTYSKTFTIIGTNPYQCNFHPLSMAGTITVQNTLSSEEITIENFKISPNPATTNIALKLPKAINITSISIYNLIGKEIFKSTQIENSIDVSKLAKGVYFLKIASKELNHTKRFIKL